jgi:hypothetical protein
MAAYMISYDLNSPGQNYPAIDKIIKSMAGTNWRILESTWIIQANLTVVQVRDRISPSLDANDKLVVVGLSGEGAWEGFGEKGNSWLKNVLNAA